MLTRAVNFRLSPHDLDNLVRVSRAFGARYKKPFVDRSETVRFAVLTMARIVEAGMLEHVEGLLQRALTTSPVTQGAR